MPVTPKARKIKKISSMNNKVLKSFINNTMPTMMGTNDTKKSGKIFSHEISFSANFLGSPFLKNIEATFPFPKQQSFP